MLSVLCCVILCVHERVACEDGRAAADAVRASASSHLWSCFSRGWMGRRFILGLNELASVRDAFYYVRRRCHS